MKKSHDQKGQLVNTLFTMLLFLVFVLCALFSVLIGGRVYENINTRTENTYRQDVALSYITNKVRQQDEAGSVAVYETDGIPVLTLSQQIRGSVYRTYIYYQDGRLWELFTDENSGLGVGDGTEIMECDTVAMTMEGKTLHVEIGGVDGGSVWLSVRSGGRTDE